MAQATIEKYNAHKHGDAAFRIWQDALSASWPLTPALFRQVVEVPGGQNFVAVEGGEVVGFVATQIESGEPGPNLESFIVAIVVSPAAQRRGVGKALHDAALNHLREAGAGRVQLGGGKITRFWPGIPDNLPAALSFFDKMGWQGEQVSYDLVQPLADYTAPQRAVDTTHKWGLQIKAGTPADVDDVLEFESREFPFWHAAIAQAASLGDEDDILVVRDSKGGVVGSLRMYGPQSDPVRTDIIWKTLLGEDVGSLGEVGIAKSEQSKGLGFAMMARGCEILRERGVGICHICWTAVPGFYVKLGFTHWRSYAMRVRKVR